MPVTLKGNVRIEGIDELNTLFQNLVPEMEKSFHEITGQYATKIHSEMTSIVPVKTGYLRSTIGTSSSTNSLQFYVTAHYAGFINYGTRRMKARPFFTGPVERQAPNMIKELNQALAGYIAANVKK
jgi:HK97 gp10 family phage protein